jgi:hypothetical protein
LIRNVGGDPRQTLRWSDTLKDDIKVIFLDGDLSKTHNLDILFGIEILRGLNAQFIYSLISDEKSWKNYFRIAFRIYDF